MASVDQLFNEKHIKAVDDYTKSVIKLNDMVDKLFNKAVNLDKQLSSSQGVKNKTEQQKALTNAQRETAKMNKQFVSISQKRERLYTKTGQAIMRTNTALQKETQALKTNQKIADSAKGSYDQLSATLQKDLKAFRALSEEERKNSAESKRLQKSISDTQKKLKDIDKQNGINTRSVGKYTNALGGLKSAFIAFASVAGIKKLVGFFGGSLDFFDKEIVAQTKLRTALGYTSNALEDQASALQDETRYGNESIVMGQAFLAQMKVQESQIKRITPYILDFAAGYGMDVNSAFQLVAKSLGSSTNALSRYGIQIEGAVGSNERLESALSALSGAFGGTAKAMANVGKGPIIQLKNLWGDLRERAGELVANGLNPLVKFASRLLSSNKNLRDSYIDQQVQVNTLVQKLRDANTSESDRLLILEKLKKIQPDITEGIEGERINYNKLNENLRRYNELQIKRIALADTEQSLEQERKAAGDATAQRMKTEADALAGIIRLRSQIAEREGPLSQNAIKNLDEIINSEEDLTTKLIRAEKEYLNFNQVVDALSVSYSEVTQARNDEAKAVQAVNDATKVYLEQQEKLFGDSPTGTNEAIKRNAAERIAIEKAISLEGLSLQQAVADEIVEIEKDKQNKIRMEMRKTEQAQFSTFEKDVELAEMKRDMELEMAAYTADGITQIFNSRLDKQLDDLQAQQEYELSLVEGNESAKDAINKRFAEKEAAIKRKQAVADKANALFGIAINTALSIIKTGANLGYPAAIPFVIAAGIAGAIQSAIVLAQPIPQFFKGTESSPEGIALVGEKGREIIQDPAGNISLTGDKPEYRYLKRGSRVINNEQTERMISAGGYDSREVMQLAGVIDEGNKRIIDTIKKKRELTIVPAKSKITERKGRYFKEYLNAKV